MIFNLFSLSVYKSVYWPSGGLVHDKSFAPPEAIPKVFFLSAVGHYTSFYEYILSPKIRKAQHTTYLYYFYV